MSLGYLWRNRERPPVFSKRWFAVWAKRILTSLALIRLRWIVWCCKKRGGKVGFLSIIENYWISGNMLNLEIGERTFIAKSVNLALHNKIKIGSRVVINSGAQILTASHRLDDIYWSTYSKPITIEDYAWIATNAIILPGVTIGIGAVVGAGAVVNRDVGAFEIVNGNTAKFVKNRIGDLNYCPVRLCAPYEAWLGKLINL